MDRQKVVVNAPNKNYKGVSVGCVFIDGQTETDDPRKLEWFKEHGYIVTEQQGNSISLEQLKKLAKEKGIKNCSKMKQEELLKSLVPKVGDEGDGVGRTKI